MVLSSYAGAAVRRKEDPRLITGSSTYVDDITLPNLCMPRLSAAPMPTPRSTASTLTEPWRCRACIAVFTEADHPHGHARDLSRRRPATPVRPRKKSPRRTRGRSRCRMSSRSRWDKVRYVGEPVAVVVAETQGAGRGRRRVVVVDYEPLDAVIDPYEAREDGAPLLYDNVKNNISVRQATVHGDVDAALASAAIRIKAKIRSPRCHPMPMEGRAIVAAPDPITRGLTVLDLDAGAALVPQRDRQGARAHPEQGARDRAGGRRRLRRQVRRLSGGIRRSAAARHAAQAAGQVDRDPRRRISWPPTTAATSGRSSRSAPTRTARSRRSRRASCSTPAPTRRRSTWPGRPG